MGEGSIEPWSHRGGLPGLSMCHCRPDRRRPGPSVTGGHGLIPVTNASPSTSNSEMAIGRTAPATIPLCSTQPRGLRNSAFTGVPSSFTRSSESVTHVA
jgi:hypothetical protein